MTRAEKTLQNDIDRLRMEIDLLRNGLIEIYNLDPEVEYGVVDEWTEADCFTKAQEIAVSTLKTVYPYILNVK